ncbi:cupin domain-containing protein [Frigidibacter sp. MR17.14]|uniref:(R)-mandelonitrile lyase n=1 Tax=Frigidibacter sp. MR17.14 TaxID=3126509 RepID=UPI003012ED60
MEIFRAGDRPSAAAPESYFTGRVRQDPVIEAPAPARLRALLVTFEPGARTHWHTHPLGQTIHVTQGTGRCQRAGGPVEVIRAGDTVWFAPGERHWHGAGPTTAMAHLAMQEAEDGRTADWADPVSEADYLG